MSEHCPCCSSASFAEGFRYEAPPAGETAFGIAPGEYRREYGVCATCGHWLARTAIDLDALYAGAYVDATYEAQDLETTYKRIMSLPPEQSDNAQRVSRVKEFWEGRDAPRTLLDVGSGLGVFPARMKETGWACTALDPDERAARFATEQIGVRGVCADFFEATGLGAFQLVTLNKVVEHVRDPVQMLARTLAFLEEGGTVYIEVPDGERAAMDPDGPNREEFFIEHLHAFSMSSLSLLVDAAGLDLIRAERLREPSGKYTLYGFCERAA